jgi:5,10-methylenetetrahydrofolate reductase
MTLAGCPKQMTYGPCGGVHADGTCEVGGVACPFTLTELPEWQAVDDRGARELNPAAARLAAALQHGSVVVADLPARALSVDSLRACAAVLSGLDAVLCGDAPRHRVQFPPAYRAGELTAAGATPWIGLSTRDRNRVALEGELAALAGLGVGAVHCVTGDHPASGGRPDAAAVFDLDSTQLTALAAGRGCLVSVGESPAAPPSGHRPARLRSKERAGADVCFVNHCGGVVSVAEFVRAARRLGSTAPMIACVPLVCDAGSAATLASFGGPGYADMSAEILAATAPRRAGIRAAIELGRQMLDTGLLCGINLSGGPADGAELAYAEAEAEVAAELKR